jgi:hypothetical protein
MPCRAQCRTRTPALGVTAGRRPQPSTWPAYGAFIGALLYGAMKVDLALKGQVGIAGFPTVRVTNKTTAGSGATSPSPSSAPPSRWPRCSRGAAASPAGSCWPRPGLSTRGWGPGPWCWCCGVLGRSELPAPTGWTGRLVAAAAVARVILWGATAVSYQRRSRGRSRPRQNDASPRCRSQSHSPPHGGSQTEGP